MSNKNWANALAQEFKKRDNKEFFGAEIGTVLSVAPLKIGIYDNQFIIDSNNYFLCKAINDMITNNEINNNDKVLVIATENNQNFFIVDKLM